MTKIPTYWALMLHVCDTRKPNSEYFSGTKAAKTYEGRIDSIHKALFVQLQQLCGQLVAGRPHQWAHRVWKLWWWEHGHFKHLNLFREEKKCQCSDLTGNIAIGPVGRNLCQATLFSVGCQHKHSINIYYILWNTVVVHHRRKFSRPSALKASELWKLINAIGPDRLLGTHLWQMQHCDHSRLVIFPLHCGYS